MSQEAPVYQFEFCGGPLAGQHVLQFRRYDTILVAGAGGKYIWNAREERYDWKEKERE